jgi:hypothetical protein
VTVIGRAFMIDNDPTAPVKVIREGFRVSPYVPGAEGTAVASYLAGEAPLGAGQEAPKTNFVESSGMSFNTLFPGDYGFWEVINDLVQQEPPEAGDPELLGLLASVGIVHGKKFEPDQRMRKILEEAAVVGNATARTVTFAARPEEGFEFYPGSHWESALFLGGYQFLDPPPLITAEGPVPVGPSDGARKLDSRTNFFYMATGTTPAMCMRLTGIGSQYIYAMRDSEGAFLDGGRSYKLTLPADIPQSRFWSSCTTARHARCSRPTSTFRGSGASPAPSRPTLTVPPTSTSDPPHPRARKTTGCKPSPARAGGQSCGSTTRSRRSSTRPGGPRRSNRSDSA